MDEMDLYWKRESSSRRERRGFITTVWGGVIRLSAPFMSPSSSAGQHCWWLLAVLVCCAALAAYYKCGCGVAAVPWGARVHWANVGALRHIHALTSSVRTLPRCLFYDSPSAVALVTRSLEDWSCYGIGSQAIQFCGGKVTAYQRRWRKIAMAR